MSWAVLIISEYFLALTLSLTPIDLSKSSLRLAWSSLTDCCLCILLWIFSASDANSLLLMPVFSQKDIIVIYISIIRYCLISSVLKASFENSSIYSSVKLSSSFTVPLYKNFSINSRECSTLAKPLLSMFWFSLLFSNSSNEIILLDFIVNLPMKALSASL